MAYFEKWTLSYFWSYYKLQNTFYWKQLSVPRKIIMGKKTPFHKRPLTFTWIFFWFALSFSNFWNFVRYPKFLQFWKNKGQGSKLRHCQGLLQNALYQMPPKLPWQTSGYALLNSTSSGNWVELSKIYTAINPSDMFVFN